MVNQTVIISHIADGIVLGIVPVMICGFVGLTISKLIKLMMGRT